MTEERLAEIERGMGEYVKVKELIAEIRRCWEVMDRIWDVVQGGPGVDCATCSRVMREF